MTIPYSALLTVDDFVSGAQKAYDFDIGDGDTLTTLKGIIQEVTGLLEGAGGLGRSLIVRQYAHYFQTRDWIWDEARDLYFVMAPQWPVVEIDTSGFTIGTSSDAWQNEQDLILYTSRFSGVVTYYSGYKRDDQTLAGLQAETGLSALGTAPSNLPYDIHSAAIELAMAKLAERRFGPGQRSRVLNAAIQSTTVQEIRLDYLDTITRRIMHHRKYI